MPTPRTLVTACLVLLAVTSPVRAEEDSEKTVPALLALLKASEARARADAAEALADRSDVSIPQALRARLAVETDFHARLALHYALARHGERSSVYALIDSLSRTGHLGSVYLGWVVGRFGKDHGWDAARWKAWIDGVSDETWREWQRRRHMPWVASDRDRAGLERAVSWWDTLGYPDVGALPFVLVSLPSGGIITVPPGEGKEHEVFPQRPAWLLEEGPDRFRVFTHGLEVQEIRKGPPRDDGRTLQATFVRADVGPWVLRCVAASPRTEEHWTGGDRETASPRTPPGRWTAEYGPDHGRDPLDLAPYDPPTWSRAFVLAVACLKRGAAEAALALWERIAWERPSGIPAPPWTSLEYVRREMGEAEAARLAERFNDPDATTAALLDAHKVWLRRYGPDAEIEKQSTVLGRMIGEEARRALAPRKAWDAMTLEERIEDSVARLREPFAWLDAEHLSDLRRAWPDRVLAEPTATMRLIEIGYPAVPRLLRALEDDTLTRCAVHHDSGHAQWAGWTHVNRLADLALSALQRITGETFGVPRNGRTYVGMWSAYPWSLDEGTVLASPRATEIRAAVRAWWTAYETQGEFRVLSAAVRRGGGDAVEAAHRLAARHPEGAAQPLIDGIRSRRAQGGGDTDDLVRLLGRLPGVEATAFLRAEATENPDLSERAQAARALAARGDPAGLQAMLRSWPPPINADWRPWDRGTLVVLSFLAGSHRVEAVRALRSGVERLPVDLRFGVARALGAAAGLGEGHDSSPHEVVSPDVRSAAEEALLSLVLDEGESHREIVFAGRDGPQRTPCVGDVAAAALRNLAPGRYRFDGDAPRAARLRARVEIANAARAACGEALLPLPPASAAPPPLPATEADRLLDGIVTAGDETARASVLRAAEAAGLALLPRLEERLRTLPAAAPGAAALDTVAQGLRNRIVAVTFGGGPAPDETLRALAESLVGRPLDGGLYVSLLLHTMKRTSSGVAGAWITAEREDGLSGVTLRVRLTSQFAPRSGSQAMWQTSAYIRAGGRTVHSGGPGFDQEYGRDPAAWREVREGLDEALRRPAADAIEAHVSVALER